MDPGYRIVRGGSVIAPNLPWAERPSRQPITAPRGRKRGRKCRPGQDVPSPSPLRPLFARLNPDALERAA